MRTVVAPNTSSDRDARAAIPTAYPSSGGATDADPNATHRPALTLSAPDDFSASSDADACDSVATGRTTGDRFEQEPAEPRTQKAERPRKGGRDLSNEKLGEL